MWKDFHISHYLHYRYNHKAVVIMSRINYNPWFNHYHYNKWELFHIPNLTVMIMYCLHNNSPVHFTIIKDLQMIDLKFAFRSMIDRSAFDRSDWSFSRIVWPLLHIHDIWRIFFCQMSKHFVNNMVKMRPWANFSICLVLGPSMDLSFCCNSSVSGYHIATFFAHSMTLNPVVSCAKFCSDCFLPLSPLGWRGIVVMVRTGGWLAATHVEPIYICNCLTDFLHSKWCGIVWACSICSCALSWSFAHLPHMGLPMCQKLVKLGPNFAERLSLKPLEGYPI